eukprot:gene8091-23500_t
MSSPATFKGAESGKSAVELARERNEITREVLISIETVKVLRERMSNCYKYEGVNHLENCKEYVEAYSNAIWEIKRKNTPAIGQ